MRRALDAFVPLVASLAVLAYILIYALRLQDAPIRSDGWSYYAYLPASIIFQDPTFTALARDCCGGTLPTWSAIERWPSTQAWVSAHPMGVAVLMLPFFVVADFLSWWSNLPRDGFSLYYQHAAGLAGVAYLVMGLWFLRRVLQRWFSPGVVLATLVCTTWGTNLFHYGTYDATYSHVFSFCLFAALLDVVPRWLESPSSKQSWAFGSLTGLIVLVRHTNVLIPLAMTFYGIASVAGLQDRARWLRSHWQQAALVVAIAMLWLLPQFWLYHHATGQWLVSSYGPSRTFQFASPRLIEVLVGPAKGLFFWSPILLLSVAGFVLMRRTVPELLLPTLLILPIEAYLIASWFDWQFGGSYGHRGFTDFLPLFSIGLAVCFDRVRHTRLVVPVSVLAAGAVLLSVAQMIQYWLRIIPISDTTWEMYRSVFLRFSR